MAYDIDDYEALRDRLENDYRDKIIEDGWGRGRVSRDASEQYGFEVSTKQARRVINRVKESAEEEGEIPDPIDVQIDEEAQKAKAIFEEVPGPDQILAALGINEEEWEVDKLLVKPYQGQAKVDKVVGTGDDGEPIIEQEQQVKQMYSAEVRLSPKSPWTTEAFVEDLLDQVADRAPVFHSKGRANPESGNMQRVLIPDIHLGKDGFQSDWGIEAAKERVLTVVDDLAQQGLDHSVEQICLPLGHDILHIDREAEERHRGGGTYTTTTGGTNVETAGAGWVALFLAGCELGEAIIHRLLEVAPVHVPIVPGNHAEHSEIAIGRVLVAEFRDSPDVTFDLDERRERFYEWGVNAFMDAHGDTCNIKDLPLNFATLNGELWGRAEWREVNTGHKHVKKSQPVGYSSNEQNGCMVRISPSLAPQDKWHARYHYHGVPGAESYIYNRERPGPFASYQRYL